MSSQKEASANGSIPPVQENAAHPTALSLAKKKIDRDIEEVKTYIDRYIKNKDYENAMKYISGLGESLYEYNQFYTDSFLESCLSRLNEKLSSESPSFTAPADENCVLFYDGFGYDTRGLTQIYLDALSNLNYKLVYIVSEHARGHIPTLERILRRANIIFYPVDSYLSAHKAICQAITAYRPARSFLCTTPYDIHGLLAFMRFAGSMVRYQINLTDHAFWLGLQAFDFCLEFRDYGAAISTQYRHISPQRLIRMNYYPALNENIPFAGYPFTRTEGDFVIFSGGFLYKTFDAELTYYKVIANILKKYGHVKFWYAGTGDGSELAKLNEAFPGRVFHTGERRDLFAVMRHIDLYLNTYPMIGGLMMQYAALAGKPPLTLKKKSDRIGILLREDSLGIIFESAAAWQNAIERYITDDKYRTELQQNIVGTVCTREDFIARVKKLLVNPTASQFDLTPYDDTELKQEYLARFVKKIVPNQS